MKKVMPIVLAFFMTGCASMFNGTTDSITLTSEVPDTKFYVNDEYIGKNSAVAIVKKKGDVVFKGSKEGCSDRTVALRRSFDPTSLLGILIDLGIVSMLIIDGAVTGAITKADKASYNLTPDC